MLSKFSKRDLCIGAALVAVIIIILIIVGVVNSGGGSSSSASLSEKIVGTWAPEDSGDTMTFLDDGTLLFEGDSEYANWAIVNGDQLKISNRWEADVLSVSISHNQMTLSQDGKAYVYHKVN